MNPADHWYVAKVVPLNRDLPVRDRAEGVILERFDDCLFALERKHPERVRVTLDHDMRRVVGRCRSLIVHGGWLLAEFTLDDTPLGAVAADRLRVGTPMSIGFDPDVTMPDGLRRHRVCSQLNEIAIVDQAAFKGAQVTMVSRRTPPEPKPAAEPARREVHNATPLEDPWFAAEAEAAARKGRIVRVFPARFEIR